VRCERIMLKPASSTGKRELILNAAAKVFSRHGFHRARMEDVAAEAGVGKGTIYEYFESKDSLFKELVREGLNFYSRAKLAETGKDSLGEKLRRLFLVHLKFSIDYRDLSKVALSDYATGSEDIRRWVSSMRQEKVARLKEMLDQAKERGETGRDLDTGVAAVLIWGALGSLWYQVTWEEPPPDIDGMVDQSVQMVMRGLENG